MHLQPRDYLVCSQSQTRQAWFLWTDQQRGLLVRLVALEVDAFFTKE